MRTEWSPSWISSRQPRKQRKFRHNAPLHVRHKFLSSHLSKELRAQLGTRSIPVRKGDEVIVLRGSFRGLRGVIDRVDLRKTKVYIDNVKVKKVDGTEALRPVNPSNLLVTKLNTEDKWRRKALERKKGLAGKEKPKEGKAEKEVAVPKETKSAEKEKKEEGKKTAVAKEQKSIEKGKNGKRGGPFGNDKKEGGKPSLPEERKTEKAGEPKE